MTLKKVTSQDGTSIAFDQAGSGPPVILVCGGSVDRSSNAALAAQLASNFTVYNYDRRGRGDSSDTQPYAVAREVEDIAALVQEAGGAACLFGSSSGAALALEAAASGLPITRLALWEPPFIVDDSRPRPPADSARIFSDFVAAGDRDAAAEFFMATVVGLPPEFAAGARNAPWWPAQLALAHTLAYDATVMGDYSLPAARARAVALPTLVLDGGASFDWMGKSADALNAVLPNGSRHTLPGQSHDVAAEALAPVLAEFFAG